MPQVSTSKLPSPQRASGVFMAKNKAKGAPESAAGAGAGADGYQVPDLKPGQYHINEIIIKRSRFITTIAHTASVDEAKTFIETIAAQHAEANHNCFAFNATAPGSTAFCGCSDDGEPKGTAGQPMLNVVLHCGVGELTAVVTRYFGGVLLGTGGLVKAYQGSVKEALTMLPTCERMIAAKLVVALEHRFLPKFKYILPNFRATLVKEDYGANVLVEVILPQTELEHLERTLVDLTNGSVKIIARS